MRRLRLKEIVAISALSFVLTGCQPHEDIIINQPTYDSEHVYEDVIVTPETNYQEEQTTEYSVVEYFDNAKQELLDYIESEDFKKLKERGKYYLVTGIDFIFYDEPINGYYFDDLSEQTKEYVVDSIETIDEAITYYCPDYKENISNKYQIVADFVSTKYLDILDYIKDYLGEENYNAIGEIKDQITGDISDKKDEVIDDIEDLYNSWKNKR